jgi:Uri superfamily endonuclease
MKKGTYQLLIHLPKSVHIRVGRKGKFRFPRGYYIYTGSAKNGFEARINRHLRKDKKLFWHIDYLLDHASVKRIFLFAHHRASECSLSQRMLEDSKAEVIVPKFGASDCNCRSHLAFFRRSKDVPSNRQTDFYSCAAR